MSEKQTTPKATEGKGEKNPGAEKLSIEELTELSPQEFAAYRKGQRDECGTKIQELLQEYGVDLSAKMIISPGEIIPQVILIDARPRANGPG